MLAKGSVTGIRWAARKEIENSMEASEQEKIGDLWLVVAKKERSPLNKSRYEGRARHWFEQAVGGVEGLTKVRLEKKMEGLASASRGSGGGNLLKKIDPARDSLGSPAWTTVGSVLVSPTARFSKIKVPYSPQFC